MAVLFFFFNDTATTEIYTLSLHDALPISAKDDPPIAGGTGLDAGDPGQAAGCGTRRYLGLGAWGAGATAALHPARSEEHTSELQSRQYLVCRLLLEKKKKITHAEEPWRLK